MGRNRVIYQSEALFTKDMGSHAALDENDQLLRVQDISHGVELAKTDVNEFGQLAAIERSIIEPPTVSLEFSYYVHGGRNEELLNFAASSRSALTQGLGNFLANDTGKNYYIGVADEGEDAKSEDQFTDSKGGVIGIGNGYITNYSVEAAVGDMPSASVSIEAANLRFNASGTDIPNPGVNLDTGADLGGDVLETFPRALHTGEKDGGDHLAADAHAPVACVKPGDILVDFNDAGNAAAGPVDSEGAGQSVADVGGAVLEGSGQMHLQNFTIDIPMARTALTRLGSRHPYSREIEVPLNITFSCSAFLADIADGNLNTLLCSDQTERNIRVKMLSNCQGETLVQEFMLKKCTLESQNFSASIGENKTVDLVFTSQIGGASDTDSGFFTFSSGDTFSASEATENPSDAS